MSPEPELGGLGLSDGAEVVLRVLWTRNLPGWLSLGELAKRRPDLDRVDELLRAKRAELTATLQSIPLGSEVSSTPATARSADASLAVTGSRSI